MAELTVLGLHGMDDVVANRYRIHRLLGKGATGSTYQAEDLKTHRWVALKVMSLKQLGNWDLLTRFEREAEALGKIDHIGVPDYIEHFQVETADDCRFYLVQEFAAGKSLDKWVADGWRATEAEVKRIGAEVLNTLAYLHELEPSMIHRDIKPQNIIRQPDGRIYLVDFGAVQSVCRDALQQRGTFVGTMGYMPPEQLRGKAVLASDLYGLGATLVYLLTHRNPDELPMERMRIAFRGRVKLSEGFADWLEKMLEPMVKNRWESAEFALQSLRTCSLSQTPPRPVQAQQPVFREMKKNHKIYVERRGLKLQVLIRPSNYILLSPAQGIAILIGLFLSCWIPLLFLLLFVWLFAQLSLRGAITQNSQDVGGKQSGYESLLLSPDGYSISRRSGNQSVEYNKVKDSRIVCVELRAHSDGMEDAKEALHLILSSGKSIRFGEDLDSEEGVWLAQQINQFLEK